MRFQKSFLLPLALAAAVVAGPVSAATINFDDQGLSGPSTFGGPATPPVVVPTSAGNVTFSGGIVMTAVTSLPANQTSLYGTADFGQGLLNPLTITFANPITNFLVDIVNGLSQEVDYRVEDNLGNSSVFTLASNFNSGLTTIGFAAAGNVVTITSLNGGGGGFDFFVDNIKFNLAIECGRTGCNPTVVPVPAALPLFLAGALGIAGFGFRRNRKQG